MTGWKSNMVAQLLRTILDGLFRGKRNIRGVLRTPPPVLLASTPGATPPSRGRRATATATATDRPTKTFLTGQLVLIWLGLLLTRLWDQRSDFEPNAKARADEPSAPLVRVTTTNSLNGMPIGKPATTVHPLAQLKPDVSFFVPGTPGAQGNKRAFRNQHTGRIAIVERPGANPHWRQDVRDAFDRARSAGQEPLAGPLSVQLRFVFQRPKSHYNSRGELKPSAPVYMTSRPDTDKLERALLDAIQIPTGGSAIADDALVVDIHATKKYGERPGCFVEIRKLDQKEGQG